MLRSISTGFNCMSFFRFRCIRPYHALQQDEMSVELSCKMQSLLMLFLLCDNFLCARLEYEISENKKHCSALHTSALCPGLQSSLAQDAIVTQLRGGSKISGIKSSEDSLGRRTTRKACSASCTADHVLQTSPSALLLEANVL
jgi:hypothetical protein